MQTVYSGELDVDYGQFYVEGRRDWSGEGLAETFAGQRNGLCGAAVPGYLFLTTGLHTGRVGLTVEVHDQAPPVTATWEEVVEVSFRPAAPRTAVFPWGDGELCAAELAETDHRVRYCARGMDVEWDAESAVLDGGPPVDHYLLQFWPAPPAPDRVIRQTSRRAAYWHTYARRLPPPPTREEAAAAERAERERKERERTALREQVERRRWGGRIPSERVRAAIGAGSWLVAWDRDLIDEVDAADPQAQRDLARWAARRALAAAGLDRIGWIAAGLDALDRGGDLPEPFDDEGRAFDRLFADPGVPQTLVPTPDGRYDNALQQAMALPALLAAADPDPLRAALDALSHAAVTWGSARPDLFAGARAQLPG
ncbi:hypothetical protein OG946_18635 [Streptomyces sp. NBC_01808]|uniref:hypothetical protein n=1 Tax=Streptomyces sp. NBC_01808 TaxID=2975947 RepID=UPI002DD97531|nr:hypothetical protein [Streptomyces sp. NBC_01808]WSA39198.1 hypothetical protein OG946_18635 [Streptomyces sp. NBC_01808]